MRWNPQKASSLSEKFPSGKSEQLSMEHPSSPQMDTESYYLLWVMKNPVNKVPREYRRKRTCTKMSQLTETSPQNASSWLETGVSIKLPFMYRTTANVAQTFGKRESTPTKKVIPALICQPTSSDEDRNFSLTHNNGSRNIREPRPFR